MLNRKRIISFAEATQQTEMSIAIDRKKIR
jgi:hypothetical protein